MPEAAAMKMPSDKAGSDVRDQRISVESRQQRPRRGETRLSGSAPDRAVDPEQIAGMKPVHFLALNDRLIKAVKPNEEQAEGGDHGRRPQNRPASAAGPR